MTPLIQPEHLRALLTRYYEWPLSRRLRIDRLRRRTILGPALDDRAVCVWEADQDGNYGTTCGNLHTFLCDGPRKNKHKFCPYCGGRLVEKVVFATD